MKTIEIRDYYGNYQEVPVSDELYEEWQKMRNETQRIHRKEVYHRAWDTLDDLERDERCITRITPEEMFISEDEAETLHRAIDCLSQIQQRRIRMYMDNMPVREIARREGCYLNSIRKSINSALKQLRIILSEWDYE